MTTIELRHHLLTLGAERAAAGLSALDRNSRYLDDLEREIATTRQAYVGAAVTEIATLRARISGRQVG